MLAGNKAASGRDSAIGGSSEGGFIEGLFNVLNNQGLRYAVLRNYETLPYSAGGSDLDILVHPDDAGRAREVLATTILQADAVAIGWVNTVGFFKVFVLGRSEHGTANWWGLRLDISCGLQYGGVAPLLDLAVLKNDSMNYRGIRVLTQNLAAVLGILKEVLHNSTLPDRYLVEATRAVKEDWQNVSRQLAPLGNVALALFRHLILSGPACLNFPRRARKLRHVLLYRAFWQSPANFIRLRIAHNWSKVRRFLRPPGAIVAVLGVDGVGKSTVIGAIKPVLDNATHGALEIRHLRPGLLPPLARLKGKQTIQIGPVVEPHGSKPSGMLGSVFRLLYLTADYVLGYWLLLRPKIAKSPAVILFDRYCYDMALDPRRFRLGVSRRVIEWFLHLIPKPDVVLCLYAEPKTIMARKQELPLTEITRQVNQLRDLARGEPGAILVSTEGTIEEIRDRVLSELTNFFRSRC